MNITEGIRTKAMNFAINAHRTTNHMYDTYLPYEYHLRMVVQIAEEFLHLVEEDMKDNMVAACWLHDTMEDCRVNYNDIVNTLMDTPYYDMAHAAISIAEIVRAVTNDPRGRNRHERFSPDVQESIRSTPGALFVKLCDRIANIQYSKMTKSSMYDMYKKEHANFHRALRMDSKYPELIQMWLYIEELFQ